MVSAEMSTANFLVVPASRRECASTNAPVLKLQSAQYMIILSIKHTGKVVVAQQQLWKSVRKLPRSAGDWHDVPSRKHLPLQRPLYDDRRIWLRAGGTSREEDVEREKKKREGEDLKSELVEQNWSVRRREVGDGWAGCFGGDSLVFPLFPSRSHPTLY